MNNSSNPVLEPEVLLKWLNLPEGKQFLEYCQAEAERLCRRAASYSDKKDPHVLLTIGRYQGQYKVMDWLATLPETCRDIVQRREANAVVSESTTSGKI